LEIPTPLSRECPGCRPSSSSLESQLWSRERDHQRWLTLLHNCGRWTIPLPGIAAGFGRKVTFPSREARLANSSPSLPVDRGNRPSALESRAKLHGTAAHNLQAREEASSAERSFRSYPSPSGCLPALLEPWKDPIWLASEAWTTSSMDPPAAFRAAPLTNHINVIGQKADSLRSPSRTRSIVRTPDRSCRVRRSMEGTGRHKR